MILFHAVSLYQVLNLIVYRVKKEEKEKAALLIASTALEKLPHYNQLEHFFDRIISYDFRQANRLADSTELLAQYFDGLFREEQLDIVSMEQIYLACAHHAFGIYMAQKGLHFAFVEDGSGALSRPWVLEKTEDKSRAKYKYAKEAGLYDGTNINITRRVYNPTNQLDGYIQAGDEAFDIVEELWSMAEEERQKICLLFVQRAQIDVPPNSVLILTEHFANLNLMTWEEQEGIYQLLVDYFASGRNLVFKPHPDDLMYYSLLFPQATIIRERFPAELLPFIFGGKVDTALTISSSSIYGIRKCFDHCIEFNHRFSYDKGFYVTHRYFAALSIAHSAYQKGKTVFTYHLDQKLVENFVMYGGVDFPIPRQLKSLTNVESNSVILIDQLEMNEFTGKLMGEWMDSLPTETMVIFLNTKEDFAFYDYSYQYLWKWIFPAEIRKRRLKNIESFKNATDSEFIYVFCKEGIGEMDTIYKTLENVGITIDVNCYDDKENRIRALVGILQATERRLLFYINKYEVKSADNGQT